MPPMSDLKDKLAEDMRSALRSGEKSRLQTIRLMLAAIKQQEIDTRKELSSQDVIDVLTRMQKQRRESIVQFKKGNRQDLVDKETIELEQIQEYLPEALSDEEIDKLIADALSSSGASSIKDMGKVMGILKPKISGRADIKAVSVKIKHVLSA